MQLLTCLFPPSLDLAAYLETWFRSAEGVPIDRIDAIARFCRRQLALILQRGARTRWPVPLAEVEAGSRGAFLEDRIFGVSLKAVIRRERRRDPLATVPALLPFLYERLDEAKSKSVEGAFRIPGDVQQIIEVRADEPQGNTRRLI
jgi:hypothetical protein